MPRESRLRIVPALIPVISDHSLMVWTSPQHTTTRLPVLNARSSSQPKSSRRARVLYFIPVISDHSRRVWPLYKFIRPPQILFRPRLASQGGSFRNNPRRCIHNRPHRRRCRSKSAPHSDWGRLSPSNRAQEDSLHTHFLRFSWLLLHAATPRIINIPVTTPAKKHKIIRSPQKYFIFSNSEV